MNIMMHFPPFLKFTFIFWRKSKSVWVCTSEGGAEREREGEKEPQAGATLWRGAWSHELWDQDLSRNQVRLSTDWTTQAPRISDFFCAWYFIPRRWRTCFLRLWKHSNRTLCHHLKIASTPDLCWNNQALCLVWISSGRHFLFTLFFFCKCSICCLLISGHPNCGFSATLQNFPSVLAPWQNYVPE